MNDEPEKTTYDDEEDEEQQPVPLSLGQQAAVFVPTAVAVCGLDAALHAPLPLAIAGLVGAYYLTRKSPTLYEAMREHLPLPALANKERAPGQWSLIDRLLDRHMQVPPQWDEDDPERTAHYLRQNGVDEKLITDLLGNSNNEEDDPEDEDDLLSFGVDDDDDDDDDLITLPTDQPKGMRVFSDLLKTGWRPSMEQIYVGTDTRGRHLFVPVASLWHVALAGATGFGKSSLMRLLMVQLCYLKLPIVLLNPHYMIYDLDHQEDWTPYTPYLKRDPMVCKKPAYIQTMLRWMAHDLLEMRKERASRGESAGKPFFFILDEYPDIKAEIKDAPTLVGKLLRQGRKYGIYLIVASQDYSVKTLGVEGEGSLRKCFRTAFYVGGDPVSVRELLNKAVKDIPENELGQGTIMLKCATINEPIVVHIPYLDNKSLYLLLGPTTYVEPGAKEVHTDELEEGTNNTSREDTQKPDADEYAKNEAMLKNATALPALPQKERKAEDIDISYAVKVWNALMPSIKDMEQIFGLNNHQARLLREKLLKMAEARQPDSQVSE
jgi:hypothetical protein